MSADAPGPHCRAPDACVAKGAGHCRACTCAAMVRKRFSDPLEIERVRRRFIAMNKSPAVRAKQTASLKRNKKALASFRSTALEKLTRMRADPEVAVRREAGKQASRPRVKAALALNLAAEVGFPVSFVAEYRSLRRSKHMTRAQALAVLRASYPVEFEEIEARRATDARIAVIRAAGPRPAINTPQHAAWTRKVNGIVEARP